MARATRPSIAVAMAFSVSCMRTAYVYRLPI
jgi:hypothetical protein